jgi:hypothetical protein
MKNAGMKNCGEAIDRVLAGLRDADAAAGMERRILDGLEKRALAETRSGWRGWLPVWLVAPARPVAVGTLGFGVALAGIFVVALAIPAIRRLAHGPDQTQKNSAPAGSPALAPEVARELAGRSVQPASLRSGVRSLEKIRAEEGTDAGGVEDVRDSDSAALENMRAASRPAPPMPLTEQERLLLRLVHKDDPVELAMLDSKVRALQDSEDKAEFQRFFGQVSRQAAPDPSVTEQAAPQQSTEQVVPGQSATEQALPPAQPGTEQAVPEKTVPEQPAQPQTTPENFAPDQSTTQQATPKPMTTGENE